MIYEAGEDSYLLESVVKKYAKGKRVLDMGSGSGIQAKAALNSGAKEVLAVDIDAESVKELRKRGLNTIKSDLFKHVKGKFDLIIFNPPYLPLDKREDKESRKATTGGKRGDEVILRFLGSVSRYLDKDGKILLLVSSLTPKEKIEKFLIHTKIKKEIVATQKLFYELLEVWKLERKA